MGADADERKTSGPPRCEHLKCESLSLLACFLRLYWDADIYRYLLGTFLVSLRGSLGITGYYHALFWGLMYHQEAQLFFVSIVR